MITTIAAGLANYIDHGWVTLGFDGVVLRRPKFDVLRSTYLGRNGLLAADGKHYLIGFSGFVRYSNLKNDFLIYNFSGEVIQLSDNPEGYTLSNHMFLCGTETYVLLPPWLVIELGAYRSQEDAGDR